MDEERLAKAIEDHAEALDRNTVAINEVSRDRKDERRWLMFLIVVLLSAVLLLVGLRLQVPGLVSAAGTVIPFIYEASHYAPPVMLHALWR